MNVSPVGSTTTPLDTLPATPPVVEPDPPVEAPAPPSPEAPSEMGRGPKAGSAGKANPPGVMRLLQEGHFKGVADVRLRINFHEAIMQQQREAVRGAAPDAVDGLTEQVADGVSAAVQSSEETEPATETPVVEAAVEEGEPPAVTEEPQPDMQAMLDQLAADFAAALEQLEQSLSETGALPPLSEPTGNGQAYAKFLEIYESLYGPLSAEQPPAEGVDIEA